MRAIFEYKNYRDFLEDRYQVLKSIKPYFSMRFLAKKAQIGSPSYFSHILKQKRRLSRRCAVKFAEALELSPIEKKWLLLLLDLESAKDPQERSQILEEMATLKSEQKIEKELRKPDHAEVLSDLLNVKLYCLARSERFEFSTKWIAKELEHQVSEKEIESRVRLLLESGLWKQEGKRIVPVSCNLKTGDPIEERHLLEAHSNVLKAAQEAIFQQPAENRISGGKAFLFDPNRMNEIRDKIEGFKKELQEEFESRESTQVYELHLDFFELKPEETKE